MRKWAAARNAQQPFSRDAQRSAIPAAPINVNPSPADALRCASRLNEARESPGSDDPTAAHIPGSPSSNPPSAFETIARAADATSLTPDSRPLTPLPSGKAFHRRVAELGIAVAEALDHAHQQGVIHRDIKPSNLMLDSRGKIWVTDLGLAHIESAGQSMTRTGDLLGTLRYMSPEQALAQRVVVDHRTDIYSLGATLYELLALKPVFNGENRQELLRQLSFDEPRALRQIDRSIPPELETIVLKSLEKNPDDRYVTARTLADDLRQFVDDKPISARRPNLVQKVHKWSRRNKPIVVTATRGVALALLVLAVSAAPEGCRPLARGAAPGRSDMRCVVSPGGAEGSTRKRRESHNRSTTTRIRITR